MAGKVSPTLRVLHELRDGQRGLERAQAETNERLERLTSRVDSLEVTVARELRAVATVLIDVRDLLYFAMLIVFFLIATAVVLDVRKAE